MIDFLTGLALIGAVVSTAAWAAAVIKLIMENEKCRMKDCPQSSILYSKFSIHTAVFLFFAAIATLFAQKQGGGTNDPPRSANVELKIENGELRNLSPLIENEPIRNSQLPVTSYPPTFLLESVFTNDSYSYAMPSNGVRYDRWWHHGAYEDVLRLGLGEMAFPLGGELLESLWVYSWGMAGARLDDASNRLVATGVPMSAGPGVSRFWSGDATNGAKLLTWENFFLDRDTNAPVSAQLELHPSGGFIARSNNVARLYRRVNPDDWDDDGVPNGEDPDPYTAGEPAFGPRQELPPGANTNAYCWVDVVVSNASSLVTFAGEGASALPDPSFVARPGETNRVTLLIGKTYHAESRMPITCVGQSSAEIEVWQDSPTEISFLWPVTIESVPMRDGLSFAMTVTPDCLGGGFTWTNSCCSISSSGWTFAYSCNGECHCTGCCALGLYTYESFSLPATGGSCGCSAEGWHDIGGTNEPPVSASISVSFSQTALFYEEAYTNEPGVVVGRRVSTNTTFSCSVSGGQYGGVFNLSCAGFDRLLHVAGDTLPGGTVEVAAGETRTWEAVYAPLEHSLAENDVSAVATFNEYMSGDAMTNAAHLTVVELKFEPQITREGCENRHLVGVREIVNCYAYPDVGEWGEIGGGELVVRLGVQNYMCPLLSDGSMLYYSFGGMRYDFALMVVEPSMMIAVPQFAYDFCVATNHAGGSGMRLQLHVLPDTVSFEGIALEEVPSMEGTHQGYFSNVFFQAVWYHTIGMGAGKWKNVKPGNFWGKDDVCMGEELPRELTNGVMTYDLSEGSWSSGLLVWSIKWGWAEINRSDGDPPAKEMTAPCNQTFAFAGNGTLSISKFQHAVSRGTNNVVRLDGVVQDPGQLRQWGDDNDD